MATKKPTQPDEPVEKQSETASDPIDLRVLYEQTLRQMELIAAQLKEQGVQVEAPPAATVSVKAEEATDWQPARSNGSRPGQRDGNSENWVVWNKDDLNPNDTYDFVPQFIPGLVHPILDENRKPKIFLNVNGLGCCLTVGVLNKNISGMFYWAYKNAEELYFESEDYKMHGPLAGPHVAGGVRGINTWHYEPEAPRAWIDLDGRYYEPGAAMPGEAQ